MEEKNKQKNGECPLCRVSKETLDQLKKADLHQCPECGFCYEGKKWAEECESWCKGHKSCNLEITKHAVKRSNQSKITD